MAAAVALALFTGCGSSRPELTAVADRADIPSSNDEVAAKSDLIVRGVVRSSKAVQEESTVVITIADVQVTEVLFRKAGLRATTDVHVREIGSTKQPTGGLPPLIKTGRQYLLFLQAVEQRPDQWWATLSSGVYERRGGGVWAPTDPIAKDLTSFSSIESARALVHRVTGT